MSLHETQTAFAAHIRDPEHAPRPDGIEARRMDVYVELFRNNIDSLLATNFPVVRELYDEEGWNALVRAFYREHRAQTPLFPEFPREFIRYLETRAERGADDAPFLLELAQHEWSELALANDERSLDDVAHDPHGDVLDGVACVSPLARVHAYRFPVQRIGPDFRPTEPDPQPVLILLVRDRADDVRFFKIDALTALLLERLAANTDRRSGRDCLDALLAEFGRAGDAALHASGCAALRSLREREAILGTVVD